MLLLGASQWACGNGDDSTALVPDASMALPDGSMSSPDAGSSNSPDAAPDGATPDTGSPDAEPDAQPDASPDAGTADSAVSDAMADADTGTTSLGAACCCEGDVSSQPDAGADGGLVCSLGSLYFGADCSRSCGPCTAPCDSGP